MTNHLPAEFGPNYTSLWKVVDDGYEDFFPSVSQTQPQVAGALHNPTVLTEVPRAIRAGIMSNDGTEFPDPVEMDAYKGHFFTGYYPK